MIVTSPATRTTTIAYEVAPMKPGCTRGGASAAGGHQLSAETAHELGGWIAHRLSWIARYGAAHAGPRADVLWPTITGGELLERRGTGPEVSWTIPPQQEAQNAPADLQERLLPFLAGDGREQDLLQ